MLNSMNINTACLGNHDFDFGLENLERFIQNTNFPWLMANVLNPATRKPLAGALPSRMCEWEGVKVRRPNKIALKSALLCYYQASGISLTRTGQLLLLLPMAWNSAVYVNRQSVAVHWWTCDCCPHYWLP